MIFLRLTRYLFIAVTLVIIQYTAAEIPIEDVKATAMEQNPAGAAGDLLGE